MIKTAFELKTIGSTLKEKRLEKKLSHEQVSEIIKINPEYLRALEEADYEKFPSEVYIKGFLKNYAKFLGIETDRALALYRREKEKQTGDTKLKKTNKIKHKGLDFSFSRGKIIAFIAFVVIILTLLFFGNYVSDVFRDPALSLTEPVALSSGENGTIETDEETITLEGNAEIGSKLSINGQEYRVNSFEQFVVDYDLSEGNNDILILLENQFRKTSEISLLVVRAEPSPTPRPTPITTPVTGNISAEIEIVGDGAYLEVTVDGELAAADAYPVDEKINFEASRDLEIFAPRPETINLFINGELKQVDSARTKFILEDGKISEVNIAN